MKRFPDELEALLSPRGLKVLRGKDPGGSGALKRGPFFAEAGLLREDALPGCTKLLAKAFSELLVEMNRPLPDARQGLLPYSEKLPKVARMRTVPRAENLQSPSYVRAEEIGLAAMMQSESYRAFAEAIAGTKLQGPENLQVLCYQPGDYAGPHTDHHPEEPRMFDGYVDMHLSFCTPGIAEQLLVYERDGHLTEVTSIAQGGLVTVYRLPFWHYTTPLQVKKANARRWLTLGTFFDAISAST